MSTSVLEEKREPKLLDRVREGHDIRTLQELLGHKSVKATMIYTHVLSRGACGALWTSCRSHLLGT